MLFRSAKANADSKIAELTASLTNTLATISETCPDVKNQFTGETISNQIDVLKVAVQVAFDNKSLATNYEQVMAPVAGIEASIAKLLADAQAAQKAYNEQSALDQARTNANSTISGLEKDLADALAKIATECPDVKQNFTGAEITAKIAVLRNDVNAAYENGTLVAEYEDVMNPASEISAAIEKMISDAQAAQQKFDDDANAEAALQEAYIA